MKIKLLFLSLALSVGVAFGQAVPSPSPFPNPGTMPTPTPTPSTPAPSTFPPPANNPTYAPKGPYVPIPAANDAQYRVPTDKKKMAQSFKKLPKSGLLEIGLQVGIYAVGEMVDIAMHPNNTTVQFHRDRCKLGNNSYTYGEIKDVICEQYNKPLTNFSNYYSYSGPGNAYIATCKDDYGTIQQPVICNVPETVEVPLDELAEKILRAAEKNAEAARIVRDWAGRELEQNPNAYPTQPQPQPQPNPNPGANPNPRPSPSPEPAPNPSPAPNPRPGENPEPTHTVCARGYKLINGICFPDAEQSDPEPAPAPEPAPNPSPTPSPSPNPSPSPSPSPGNEPAPSPNPGNAPAPVAKPFELPAFCSWAKVVCDFVEWVKRDDIDKDTQFDFDDDEQININTDIKFGGQCPNDVILSGSIFGTTITIPLFEWVKFCEFLSYIRYVVIAVASYQAVRIVGGVNVAG